MTLDFKDKPAEGQCSVKRCRQSDGLTHFSTLPSGTVLMVCPRHAKMSSEPTTVEVVEAPTVPTPAEIVVHAKTVAGPQAEAAAEAADAEKALAFVQTLEIQSQETLEFAASLLAEIKGKNNRLEALKKTATAPLNESLKAIRSWFAPAQGALATMEGLLKEKIASFHAGLEAKRVAAVAEIAEAATKEQVETALSKLSDATDPGKIEGLQVREVDDFEIVDPFALPRDCLMPDLDYIKQKVKAGIDIPGVRRFKRSVVASRAA